MCGIYCSNLSPLKKGEGERLLKLRGPDHLSKIQVDDFYISHSLLSITGEIAPQPLVKDNIVCLYNGEIYNHQEFGDYDTDGKAIIDAYIKHGIYFPKYLDGEFALILYDPKKRVLIMSTDTFSTKPIYYSLEEKELGCSSYRTPLEEAGHKNIKKLPANTIRVFNMLHPDHTIYVDHTVTAFDLEQKNNSFDGWINAFEKSIEKRTKSCNKKIFIGLSSGYDSGVICSELLKQNKEFKAYSVVGSEDENIIEARKTLVTLSDHGKHEILYKNDKNYSIAHEFIEENTEKYKYDIDAKDNPYDQWRGCDLINDSGSNWLSLICKYARDEGYKIHLSGMGADEIFSDYGFNGEAYLPHSNFGGLFPDNLHLIFPWKNFYNGSMDAYLTKEEYVGGAYSIETRYPFLDKYVVQEFLSLDKDLKNSYYKSVLYNYLQEKRFPFRENQKLGF